MIKNNTIRKILILTSFVVALIGMYNFNTDNALIDSHRSSDNTSKEYPALKFDGPAKYAKLHHRIRTRPDEHVSGYDMGYTLDEYKKAVSTSSSRNTLEWKERGPANVGGRTRAILLDPTDSTKKTFYTGTAGGGIWKTTDGAKTWSNLTPSLPNLALSTLALSISNPNTIYAGTGEGFDGQMVVGSGIWKSINKGESWDVLESTKANDKFKNILRMIVNPANENEILVCTVGSIRDLETQSYIHKSMDGGLTWEVKHQEGFYPIQQILYTPGDFNTMYASVNSKGILKSTDAGETWNLVFDATINGYLRMEIAISPQSPAHIYISAENEESAALLFSRDTMHTVNSTIFESTAPNWLGGQGWYDNAIAAHPYDKNKVWVGGSGPMIAFEISEEFEQVKGFKNFVNSTGFLINVEGAPIPTASHGVPEPLYNALGYASEISSDELVDVEIRFGPGLTQKAHSFILNEDDQFEFQNYIDVPFQAWDTVNDRQLMISFADLDENEEWSFAIYEGEIPPDVVFIHALDYTEEADNIISTTNPAYKGMYHFYKQKNPEYEGTVNDFTRSSFFFHVGTNTGYIAGLNVITDGYNELGQESKGVHVDHHNIMLVPIDESTNSFYVINANDGGIAFSSDNGATFLQTGDTFNSDGEGYTTSDGYNVGQFYGVDKMNGSNRYVGGTQDNGSWVSAADSDETTKWVSAPSGDGFEAAWNYGDVNQILESSQYNSISKSNDGGESWHSINLPDSTGPFLTRIVSSQIDPDLVFFSSSKGVIKSTDFGDSWEIKTMPDLWNFSFDGPPLAISLSDADIIWSGSGITEDNRVALSTDKGDNWISTANYTEATMGNITGIATHPLQANTAYVLFSMANGPKILKTTNLGETWTDISGFVTNKENSDSGFPDVATYSLLVMPWDTNHIWVGTEIGLFESLDNGASWGYANNGLPAVGIWQMKIVNDEIILATHGRGVWTVNTKELKDPSATNEITNIEANLTITPNPITDNAIISFELKESNAVRIELYDVQGKLLKTVFQGKTNGTTNVNFNRENLYAGVYFVTLNTSTTKITKKIIIQ